MPWLILAWSCAALALAASRVPYDDEWFSIELASPHTPLAQFWHALRDDMHPPWFALLDRSLSQLTAAPLALQALRIAASAAAIALLARALSRRLALPDWAFVAAAAHPIVLFYAGSARWYPFLLLAHALRAFAIWRADRRNASAVAFVAGAIVGSLATYLDVLFLVHDALWFVAVQPRTERKRWRVGLPLLAAAACSVLLRLVSPLQGGAHAWSGQTIVRPSAIVMLQWAALGIAGEAALPWPWILTGTICGVAGVWAFVSALRDPSTRSTALWFATYASTWLIGCGFGVWHPRYSLMLWLLAGVLVFRLAFQGGRAPRVVAALSAIHLAIVLALVVAGRGFFKADLNTLRADDCSVIERVRGAPLVVVPYPRLAALITRQCPAPSDMLVLRSIWMTWNEADQLRELDARMPGRSPIWLLSTHVDSSLELTQERARTFLGRHCKPDAPQPFGAPPHPWLRRDRSATFERYDLQRWTCPAH